MNESETHFHQLEEIFKEFLIIHSYQSILLSDSIVLNFSVITGERSRDITMAGSEKREKGEGGSERGGEREIQEGKRDRKGERGRGRERGREE